MNIKRRTTILLVVAVVLVSAFATQPKATGAESGQARIASAVIDRWAAAYTANNVDAVISNYTPDVILLGTSHPISLGTAGVREYFRGYPTVAIKSSLKSGQ